MTDVQKTALALAREVGFINMTRASLCERLDIPEGSFVHRVGYTYSDFIARLRRKHGAEIPDPDGISKVRCDPTLCRSHLLKVAVELSKKRGYLHVTHAMVAEEVGVSRPLVAHYLGNTGATRDAIMVYARRHKVLGVLAQGLRAPKSRVAMGASALLRAQAYDFKGDAG